MRTTAPALNGHRPTCDGGLGEGDPDEGGSLALETAACPDRELDPWLEVALAGLSLAMGPQSPTRLGEIDDALHDVAGPGADALSRSAPPIAPLRAFARPKGPSSPWAGEVPKIGIERADFFVVEPLAPAYVPATVARNGDPVTDASGPTDERASGPSDDVPRHGRASRVRRPRPPRALDDTLADLASEIADALHPGQAAPDAPPPAASVDTSLGHPTLLTPGGMSMLAPAVVPTPATRPARGTALHRVPPPLPPSARPPSAPGSKTAPVHGRRRATVVVASLVAVVVLAVVLLGAGGANRTVGAGRASHHRAGAGTLQETVPPGSLFQFTATGPQSSAVFPVVDEFVVQYSVRCPAAAPTGNFVLNLLSGSQSAVRVNVPVGGSTSDEATTPALLGGRYSLRVVAPGACSWTARGVASTAPVGS